MGGLLPVRCADQRGRKFLPVGRRSESFEVEEAATAEHGVGDSDNSPQPPQSPFVNLVPAEQIGVTSEVSEEPTELPQGSGIGVEPTGDRPADILLGLEDDQAQGEEGLLRMAAVEGTLDPNQEEAFEIGVSVLRGTVQSREEAFHKCTSGVAA